MTNKPYRASGFSLLEVLIALLVFSLGLLGVAGMLVISVKTNNQAYLRTQASFLAQSMADRMRANVPRVWAGDYSQTFPTAETTDPCPNSSTMCTNTLVATRDRVQWNSQLKTQLPPLASAVVSCNPSATVTVSPVDQANGAPYTGLCTITMAWSEASLDKAASANNPDTATLVWRFQP
ncbi:type IV pilus modification protein PilV [Rudaea sp.]|uniref:type IV pilus modification protein PilV n=1 Tax=Rudaea sp. TaxID=2136325 RepID=UPI00321FCA76